MLDKLRYFKKTKEFASGGFVENNYRDRSWESFYEDRWHFDKVVRSTHGVNCTGSCSWRIFVKNGVVTWEMQEKDYPKNRPTIPNHEPRGCPRGASYSWYLYNSGRVKHPMIRTSLLRAYRAAKAKVADPVNAWKLVVEDNVSRSNYVGERGLGGFVRSTWEEALEMIAAANIYTTKEFGPDRIVGFSPIPAFSMVSYCAGTRYLSLLGGTILSFYDFYCDLPPSSPQTWGEQTDVPESADWYSSDYLLMWGSNVPVTRTPDAHFMTEVRYKGTKVVVVSPDYNDAAKFADTWMNPKQGTDSALGMAMGHVILTEFYRDKQIPYFEDYIKRFSNLPFLVKLDKQGDKYVPGRMLRASDFTDNMGIINKPQWRVITLDKNGELKIPNGSIATRWDKSGKWNLELKDERDSSEIDPEISLIDKTEKNILDVLFPYFGEDSNPAILDRKVPAIKMSGKDGDFYCTTAFDLLMANYGVDRGLDDNNCAKSYDDLIPFTPAWQEEITGVKRGTVINVAREFAQNAIETEGASMVIIGAGVNQWYNTDMTYRSVINMCVLCGCIGKTGGGLSHYVGQEKIRPLAGWGTMAFAGDWIHGARQMNATNYFYQHTDQWRYEKVQISDILSPVTDKKRWEGMTLVDSVVKAQRLGWTPVSPQIDINPLSVNDSAKAQNMEPDKYLAEKLGKGEIKIATEDVDSPKNWPRNLFIWRSNLIGCSGKGMEYFMKHLLGTQSNVLGEDLEQMGEPLPKEVVWHKEAVKGKCDLIVTADYRMTTSSIHSDIVLPAATWYEKNDVNTTDMHQFVHPLQAAVEPLWESRSDWDIFKSLAEKFSKLCQGHLGVEVDTLVQPWLHDTPGEISESITVEDWKEKGTIPVPGNNMPNIIQIERNYPQMFNQFTSLGPNVSKNGVGTKGYSWKADEEVEFLGDINFLVDKDGISKGRPKIDTDIDGVNTILTLSPETNGGAAVKAWESLKDKSGIDLKFLTEGHASDHLTFDEIKDQPRRTFTSPCWSGVDNEKINYNAFYINTHYNIPWRTLSGRQEIYLDHPWQIDFGESLVTYRPPLVTKSVEALLEKTGKNDKVLVAALPTPHNKWSIHSMWSDNLLMLTLGRGGPVVWINEKDAAKNDINDNDFVEIYNDNGATMARAVVTQKIPMGLAFLYHNQERTVNMPVAPITGNRGGVHNSISKLCPRPTHCVGGYAQLSFSLNYYGSIGANRDEIVLIRKVADKNIEWKTGDE